MPNQRKQGLKLIGAYVDAETHDRLMRLAASRGKTLADIVREIADEIDKEYGQSEPKGKNG